MDLAEARRSTVAVSVLILTLVYVLAVSLPLWGHATERKITKADRPGDMPYTPTRLEWAALELQTYFGRTLTPQDHVDISYMSAGEGTTIRCILQYTPDVAAQDIKMDRDIAQVNFDKYATRHGWPWLRLQFEEHTMPAPH